MLKSSILASAFLFLLSVTLTEAFYTKTINVYLCKRPIRHTPWNNLHHELWMRDFNTGSTSLITFDPGGITVRHDPSDSDLDSECKWEYKGDTSLANVRNLWGHLNIYRSQYSLFRNNCQHFTQQALNVLGL